MKASISLPLALCALLAASTLRAEEAFRIGAILALSGEFSAFGNACRNGMVLAESELRSSNSPASIELVFEDDGLNAQKALKAFEKLSSVDQVRAIITFSSGPSNAVAPLANSAQTPMIAIGVSDEKVIRERPFVYSLWVSPATEMKVLLDEAGRRGYKRIARVAGTQESIVAMKRSFDGQNRGHVDISPDQEFGPEVRDFRPFIARLRNQSQLDAVFAILMPQQAGLFAKQLREAGLRQPLFGIETLHDPDALHAADGALKGAWYVQPADASPEFIKLFETQYPGSASWSAANCYDAVKMLAEASVSNVPVSNYLRDIKDFKGALGTFSSTKDGHFSLGARIAVVSAPAPDSE